MTWQSSQHLRNIQGIFSWFQPVTLWQLSPSNSPILLGEIEIVFLILRLQFFSIMFWWWILGQWRRATLHSPPTWQGGWHTLLWQGWMQISMAQLFIYKVRIACHGHNIYQQTYIITKVCRLRFIIYHIQQNFMAGVEVKPTTTRIQHQRLTAIPYHNSLLYKDSATTSIFFALSLGFQRGPAHSHMSARSEPGAKTVSGGSFKNSF